MDTDLQDPPRVSLEMVDLWESGVDVVYGQRRSRKDSVFKRSTAYVFYWALDRVASIEIPRNVGDFRLMDAKVVAEVARYREHGRFLRGIVAHVGFRQEALLFDRDERFAGETGYPLRKMLSFAANGILGFSTAPLRMISRLGIFISLLSVLLALYVLYVRVFEPDQSVPGWAFLGVGMFLLGGIQLIMMGVIGMYLGRVYIEAQDRPLYSLAAGRPRRRLAPPAPAPGHGAGRPGDPLLSRPGPMDGGAVRRRSASATPRSTGRSSCCCTTGSGSRSRTSAPPAPAWCSASWSTACSRSAPSG